MFTVRGRISLSAFRTVVTAAAVGGCGRGGGMSEPISRSLPSNKARAAAPAYDTVRRST